MQRTKSTWGGLFSHFSPHPAFPIDCSSSAADLRPRPSGARRIGQVRAVPETFFQAGTSPMASPVIAEPRLRPAEHLEALIQRRLGSRVRDFRLEIRTNGLILQG